MIARSLVVSDSMSEVRHDVVVGRVGIVYSGDNEKIASEAFDKYVELSNAGDPRVGGEAVTWFTDAKIVAEHAPTRRVTMYVWAMLDPPYEENRVTLRRVWLDYASAVAAKTAGKHDDTRLQLLTVCGNLRAIASAPRNGRSILLYYAGIGFIQGRYVNDNWLPVHLPRHEHTGETVEPVGWLPLPLQLDAVAAAAATGHDIL